jgi:demethylmenaquinone methyltransferase/2-methoxy-6-polyprenyl-1,4-benzoquinol methylase
VFGNLKENKAAYVQALFTAIAGNYDLFNSMLSLRRDNAWRRFAVSRCNSRPGGLVLDVAIGTGEFARHISQRNYRSTIIGVDFCSEMLLKAKGKLTALPNGNLIELVLGDILRLPFPGNIFECATIGFALRNVADIESAFYEINRVVKPGGTVVSLELTRPSFFPARILHNFILFRIAPLLGRFISGSREAYMYLPDSIAAFPSPKDVQATMEKAGLRDVEIYRLTLGMATVHVAIKGG